MNEKKEKKFNIFNLIINLIALLIIIVFLCLIYFSYNNFSEVKNGNKPSGYKNVKTYIENDKNITVYNYTLYKIIIIEQDDSETYMLKPIFSQDY